MKENKVYTVTCIETCPECNGVGTVQSQSWTDFWSEVERSGYKAHNMGMDDFNDLVAVYEDNFGGLGPQTIPCSECDGIGEKIRKVPLLDALHDLGIMPRD